MENLESHFKADIEQINSIPVVPAILEAVCRTTGMGFAAVARVTPERWINCAVKDDINFGLLPGSELKVDTTICHEIRESGQEVVIDHVAQDEQYRLHHTPAMYGFQSYISVPIFKHNGYFWGTLCAIDPNPAVLKNSPVRSLFKLYAELIGLHLETRDNAMSKVEMLNSTTLLALQKQLQAIGTHTADSINSRKLSELQQKELATTISRITEELGDLIKQLKAQLN